LRSRLTIWLLGVLCAALLVTVVLVIVKGDDKKPAIGNTGFETPGDNYGIGDDTDYRTIEDEGKELSYNPAIKNYLFLGVDKTIDTTQKGQIGAGGRTDCMILLVADTENRTIQRISISRDTMVDVAMYYQGGDYSGTSKMQITMQYSYGTGTTRSCYLTKKAVSQLLCGIPINGCIAMNIDGIGEVTELVGGVELTMPKDYTGIHKDFAEGKTLLLSGDIAEKYVRYRDIETVGSNNDRMERQMHFLNEAAYQIRDKILADDKLLDTILNESSTYLYTDLYAEEMKDLAGYKLLPETLYLPGNNVPGAYHDEFYADEEKIYEIVKKVFYK